MQMLELVRTTRTFGPNIGEPVLSITVGEGPGTAAENVKTVLENLNGIDRVYIHGEIVGGLSSFINTIVQMKVSVEVDLPAEGSTPGWLNKPDLVVMHYRDNAKFNYFTLRKRDVITFKILDRDHLHRVGVLFEELKLTPATKWLIVSEDLYWDAFELIVQHKRCKLTVEVHENGKNNSEESYKEKDTAGVF